MCIRDRHVDIINKNRGKYNMFNEDEMELSLETVHNHRLKQEDRDYKNLLDNELPRNLK